jgi:2-oxoglutarate dehydrogenase E2 component (dihydrolipoamide succinyltransferase)
MPTFELKMPKLGESVEEATITKWFIKVNDIIDDDQPLLEIATDKVDSEIPSPVSGRVTSILFKEGEKVLVGKVIAVIDLAGEASTPVIPGETAISTEKPLENKTSVSAKNTSADFESSTRFYSPLVKSISQKENISIPELEQIDGTGKDGRVRKEDILKYIENRTSTASAKVTKIGIEQTPVSREIPKVSAPAVSFGAGDEIIEMDRMRKLIADHMVMSKQVSPHVTNVVEIDVTPLVLWREKNKNAFEKREHIKLTYMPVFTEAVAKALKAFPMVNASVDGNKIILRKSVNVGIAVSLPNGNLIVPVIKNADQKSVLGIAAEMNRLADAARANKLGPDDIQGGTFTISNFGSFKNDFGTPIINQPQVAILATGMINKKPAVLETPTGDVIAIRHKMYLSMTYDHRIVDGSLGGAFLRKVADHLENWDVNQTI